MLYLSELIGKIITSSEGKPLGKLTDIVFISTDVPLITKLEVKTSHNTTMLFPADAIRHIDGTITLEKPEAIPLGENEVYAAQNLLDQQIIDIKGKNIVRVNDVVIQDKPTMTISGIDIGLSGILRWFYLERLLMKLLHRPLKQTVLPWSEIQPLELARGKVILNKEEDKLKSISPEDLADYLEKTTIHNAMKILSLVNKKTASSVIQSLNINYQTQIFRHMSHEQAANIVTYADPDEAADLLLTVSHDRQEHILSLISKEKKKELSFLLSHADTDVGELMTTEFIAFEPEDTAGKALQRIKEETREFDTFSYGYVINKEEELTGVFSLHELLMQPSDTQLLKFMTQNVIVIHMTTPLPIAMRRMLKFKLRAIPVIDRNRKILGLVTFDDIVEPLIQKL